MMPGGKRGVVYVRQAGVEEGEAGFEQPQFQGVQGPSRHLDPGPHLAKLELLGLGVDGGAFGVRHVTVGEALVFRADHARQDSHGCVCGLRKRFALAPVVLGRVRSFPPSRGSEDEGPGFTYNGDRHEVVVHVPSLESDLVYPVARPDEDEGDPQGEEDKGFAVHGAGGCTAGPGGRE